ncbi:XRE family transcriptional regulator [Burkholderia ubonensis]|uniref:helix-turn-helix domain-containing protein n=1 Tax=Burkholderia ubonensis TaxID=101571 RepID=UPI000757AECA|nr:helix-turn-helix transcriptional regulator [Burkholderia ubonensis]KVT83084.1 XRE family transcriptional regulator [Burkholderia ubonensis]
MAIKHSLAVALRMLRKARGLSQDAFSNVSSRTYLSSLERDLKCPTLNKLAEICEVLDVHPLTLLILAYSDGSVNETDQLLLEVQCELASVLKIDHKVGSAGLPH